MAKKIDINKYLYNNKITNQSLIDMANRDRIDPMDSYASIFAANTGSNVDDSVMRAMSDYYTKNPIGEKTRANVEQYGVGEGDFINKLSNLQKNYTVSIGPALQNRINANARGMEPTSLQNEPMPTSAAAPMPTSAPSFGIKDAKNVGQALRYAGEGGISKQELNKISKIFDKTGGAVVQRLDKANQNIRAKGNTGINLNSGAANMLIRQQAKQIKQFPTGYQALLDAGGGGSPFGSGRIGSVLEARSKGTDVLGKPGNRMRGGTTIRPGGREAEQGFGRNQYQGPKPTNNTTPSITGPGPSALPGGGGVDANDGAIAAGNNPQFNPAVGGVPSPVSPAASPNLMPSNTSAIRTASGITSFQGKTKSRSKKAGIGTTIAK